MSPLLGLTLYWPSISVADWTSLLLQEEHLDTHSYITSMTQICGLQMLIFTFMLSEEVTNDIQLFYLFIYFFICSHTTCKSIGYIMLLTLLIAQYYIMFYFSHSRNQKRKKERKKNTYRNTYYICTLGALNYYI